MQCLPDNLRDRVYYRPTNEGIEKRIRERMEEIKKLRSPAAGNADLTLPRKNLRRLSASSYSIETVVRAYCSGGLNHGHASQI